MVGGTFWKWLSNLSRNVFTQLCTVPSTIGPWLGPILCIAQANAPPVVIISIPLTICLAQIPSKLLKERESAILTYSSILSKFIAALSILNYGEQIYLSRVVWIQPLASAVILVFTQPLRESRALRSTLIQILIYPLFPLSLIWITNELLTVEIGCMNSAVVCSWNTTRHPFSKAWQYHIQTVIQPCMWFMEELSQFSMGQTAQR